MKKASITVFLSLILVLLFSFLLTALEAARIRGATAYVSMVSELAGDSFLASYYYPLFQNYRLFGVDAGDEKGYFSESVIEEGLKENLVYGMEGINGGLLQFQDTGVTQLEYNTLLSDGGEGFLSQVRQQVVLDGLSMTLQELFSEEMFAEAGVVGEIYREQEEALAVTATVTAELVRLMELVDGVRMNDNGIAFDENGKMQGKEAFIKQLVCMEQREIKALYDSEEVFRAISDKFFRADRAANKILELITEAERMEKKITASEKRIARYEDKLESLEEKLEAEEEKLSKQENPDETRLSELQQEIEEMESSIEEEEEDLKEYEDRQDAAFLNAKTQYKILRKKLQAVEELLEDGLDTVETIEKKQKTAKVAVGAYEVFLESVKPGLSEELYQVFWKELEKMKIYAGLDEKGFSVDTMRDSLQTNKELLEELSLSGFSEKKLEEAKKELRAVKSRMGEYTVEGLWFSYGDIVVAEQTWDNVTGYLGELLTTGVLSLVGISKEEQSDGRLSGEDLPSAGLEKEKILSELMTCIEEVQSLFRNGGMKEVLQVAGNAFLDGTALELYSMQYFHSYGEESPYTKLAYEREYLIFGEEKDKSNLLSMVLHLVAIRALFCMVMILKHPERMAKLEALSAGVTGFTGIPVLAAVVKYSVLLLWSVEEALVEVTALLQGKRVAVIGTGTVSFGELFLMNKAAIARKAQRIPDGIGAAYQDYLTLLSLTRETKKRAYRAMDLIQENIRCRYNDSFRIRNVVTELSFCSKTTLEKLFDTGFFSMGVYELEYEAKHAY